MMTITVRKPSIGLFVDHSTHQWVVQDREGRLWVVPAGKDQWSHREPFEPDEQTNLEPVPKHYSYLLDLKI